MLTVTIKRLHGQREDKNYRKKTFMHLGESSRSANEIELYNLKYLGPQSHMLKHVIKSHKGNPNSVLNTVHLTNR